MALRATVSRLATSQGLSAPAGAPVFSASLPEAKARSRQFFREVRTRPRDPNPVARATAGSDPNPTLGLLFRARFEENFSGRMCGAFAIFHATRPSKRAPNDRNDALSVFFVSSL
jgi:hypothetical protein